MKCTNRFYLHNYKFKPSKEFSEELFQQGVSLYEVIRIENGIPLFLEEHLNRLYHSAEISGLNIEESYCDFEILIEQLINKNIEKKEDGKIKIIVHFNSPSLKNEKNLLIYFTQHYFPNRTEIENGVNVGICKTVRSNPNAKILNTNARSIANNYLAENKLFEVLLQDTDGYISEGSRSNIFFIKDDILFTPPELDILKGITRSNILKLCTQNGIKVIERKIRFTEISEMDAVFLSGTSLKVLPIRNIENKEFNAKNNLIKTLSEKYNSLVSDYIKEKST